MQSKMYVSIQACFQPKPYPPISPRPTSLPLTQAFYENTNASIPDYDSLPERTVVRPDYDDVFEDSNWWASGDDAGANSFLTMPYFPFFSSCAGHGNHMSFAKLVESHPDCALVGDFMQNIIATMLSNCRKAGSIARYNAN